MAPYVLIGSLLIPHAISAAVEPPAVMRLRPTTEVIVERQAWTCQIDLVRPMPGCQITVEGLPGATVAYPRAQTAVVTWPSPVPGRSHVRARLVMRDRDGTEVEIRELLLVVRLPAAASN